MIQHFKQQLFLLNPILDSQKLLLNHLESLESLKNSKDISELLFNIAKVCNININKHHLKHFDSKSYCDSGQFYLIYDCANCGKRAFMKIPCNSFFCEDCRKHITSRIRRHTKSYLWACNHLFSVWTVPPEISKYINSWEAKQKINLIFKAVELTFKQYCKKRKIEIGIILFLHTYGSLKLNWLVHLNALTSSKALTKENKIIDFKPDFKELRNLYKKNLSKLFKTPIYNTPQINFSKDTKTKSYYIPYKRAVNKVLSYFRHIPLKFKNIDKITNDSIIYHTSKSKQLNKKPFKVSYREFLYLFLQHIPPNQIRGLKQSGFRNIRQVGLYSNNNKNRLKYPTNPDKKPKKELKCKVCKSIIKRENIVGLVHKGLLVWVNISNESMLDYKDFDYQKESIIAQNGRLLEALAPPNDFIPYSKPEFIENDDDEDNENYEEDENNDFNFKPSNKFKDVIHIPMFEFKESESEFNKTQIRFNRLSAIRLKNKIKLTSGELIELAILGKC